MTLSQKRARCRCYLNNALQPLSWNRWPGKACCCCCCWLLARWSVLHGGAAPVGGGELVQAAVEAGTPSQWLWAAACRQPCCGLFAAAGHAKDCDAGRSLSLAVRLAAETNAQHSGWLPDCQQAASRQAVALTLSGSTSCKA
jgi:hypothetical protein